MKFLIITNHSYMLWQFRRELISELQKLGDIVISMPFVGHEDDFKAMGCKCINIDIDRRGINPKTDINLYREYCKLLKDEKPDMVITYSIKPNIYAGYACRRMKIPYCVNITGLGTAFQSKGLATVVTKMYKVALKKAKTVFFENEGNAQVFVDRKILKKEDQTVLHGAGVNLEYYDLKPYPDEDGGIHFLYLGRIMKEKGMDELFYAVRKLNEKYGNRCILDIVGFFEDEYKETVEQLVKDGLAVYHGFQTDPRPYYEAAHAVVLPSYHEGMSNVLLEAASTGRAVITSDIPGCREAVDSNVSGLLCPKMDREALLSQMDKFVSMSTEQRKHMGEMGRNKMKSEFNKADVVRETIAAIMK